MHGTQWTRILWHDWKEWFGTAWQRNKNILIDNELTLIDHFLCPRHCNRHLTQMTSIRKKKKRFKKLQLNQSDENNTWARISDTKCYVRAG